jgi:hypothetical protein
MTHKFPFLIFRLCVIFWGFLRHQMPNVTEGSQVDHKSLVHHAGGLGKVAVIIFTGINQIELVKTLELFSHYLGAFTIIIFCSVVHSHTCSRVSFQIHLGGFKCFIIILPDRSSSTLLTTFSRNSRRVLYSVMQVTRSSTANPSTGT